MASTSISGVVSASVDARSIANGMCDTRPSNAVIRLLPSGTDPFDRGTSRQDGTAPSPRLPPTKGLATRASSGKVLNAIAQNYPWLVGGAADLGTSTKTPLQFEGAGEMGPREGAGRNLHFGVREHAMGAILSGLALTG